LESLLVGPVPVGVSRFVFEADAPHVDKIPKEDLIGVTVILLTCSYKDKEFVRIGYYVDNAYVDEALLLAPPDVPVLDKIHRSILAEKPRVTRFPINWDDPSKEEAPPAQLTDGDMVDDDVMDADNQFNESAIVDDEDEGEDEDDEEEEEEDEDEKGEVDLAMTEDLDEADNMSDEDDDAEEEDEAVNAAEDEDDDMMVTDEPVAQHMVAHVGMSSVATMEVE
ncbi:Histone chaperone asf1, partial [Coemansia sp. 'formosensis']